MATETKRPRKKFKPKEFTPIKPKFITCFESVLTYAQEIHAQIESGSPMNTSASRVSPVDYLICISEAVRDSKINKPLQKKWAKLLAGEEINPGSRTVLVSRLAPLFIRYSLFPRAKFYCDSTAYAEGQKKKKQLLLSMTAKQVRTAVAKFNELPKTVDSVGIRRFEDTAPMVLAEPWEPETQITSEYTDADAADPFVRQAAEYSEIPLIEEVTRRQPDGQYNGRWGLREV